MRDAMGQQERWLRAGRDSAGRRQCDVARLAACRECREGHLADEIAAIRMCTGRYYELLVEGRRAKLVEVITAAPVFEYRSAPAQDRRMAVVIRRVTGVRILRSTGE